MAGDVGDIYFLSFVCFLMPHLLGNLYLSGIFHVVGAVLLLLCYKPLPAKQEIPYLARLKKLDFVGCLLFAIGWCLL